MPTGTEESESASRLQQQLKALGNRYAVEILQVLSPEIGDIIPSFGWDRIVDGILRLSGFRRPRRMPSEEKTVEEAEYEKNRQRFV
ncbi:MAG: hypothetical protein ACFFC0_09205, partial [Promethearchaeota archaeon]